jgi:hypothetical protein
VSTHECLCEFGYFKEDNATFDQGFRCYPVCDEYYTNSVLNYTTETCNCDADSFYSGAVDSCSLDCFLKTGDLYKSTTDD